MAEEEDEFVEGLVEDVTSDGEVDVLSAKANNIRAVHAKMDGTFNLTAVVDEEVMLLGAQGAPDGAGGAALGGALSLGAAAPAALQQHGLPAAQPIGQLQGAAAHAALQQEALFEAQPSGQLQGAAVSVAQQQEAQATAQLFGQLQGASVAAALWNEELGADGSLAAQSGGQLWGAGEPDELRHDVAHGAALGELQQQYVLGAQGMATCVQQPLPVAMTAEVPDEAVRAAANIKEVVATQPRSSPRLVDVVDSHVMERAKMRPAWRNLESGEGTSLSILSFSDHVVSSKFANLGINLGNDDLESRDAVWSLKQLEFDRISSIPTSEVEVLEVDDTNKKEEDLDIENLALGHLCGDLMEEVMDEDSDRLSCDFQTVFRKNKSRKKNNPNIRVVKKHNKGYK